MDAEFNRRWREIDPPFDGVTITIADYLPLETLRIVLIEVLERLHFYRVDPVLSQLDDWHEHDGYIKKSRGIIAWQEIVALLTSSATLLSACTQETYVRRGYFPPARDYYLRLYITDKSDNPFYAHDDPNLIDYGTFDLTCARTLAEQIVGDIKAKNLPDLTVTPAKDFFDRNYGG